MAEPAAPRRADRTPPPPPSTTSSATPRFRRFVALGDSLTEGVGDVPNPDGTERGWADRFARQLAAVHPDLRYANLAVRGRLIADAHDQQLGAALALRPDLVSVVIGGNDLTRPRFDLHLGLARIDEIHRQLHAAGATVLTATVPDGALLAPAARLLRGRIARFNEGVRRIAARRGSLLLDAERDEGLADPDLWCEDRFHLSPRGHDRLAEAMAGTLGLPGAAQLPVSTGPVSWDGVRRPGDDLRWVRAFLLPWLGRRLTGRSSGTGRRPKRPVLLPVTPLAANTDDAAADTGHTPATATTTVSTADAGTDAPDALTN
ncbi:MAG TPA: SGNH/GDSL hydrolase family protein [Acidimicrobiales bacterium]